MEARENLDERRFARAVLAEKPVDFARQDVERRAVQRPGAAKSLADVGEAENRRPLRSGPGGFQTCSGVRAPVTSSAYCSFHSLWKPEI